MTERSIPHADDDRITWLNLRSVALPLANPISDAKVLTGRQKPMTEIASSTAAGGAPGLKRPAPEWSYNAGWPPRHRSSESQRLACSGTYGASDGW